MHTCIICGKTTDREDEFTIISINRKEEAYCPDHNTEMLQRVDQIFAAIGNLMDSGKVSEHA